MSHPPEENILCACECVIGAARPPRRGVWKGRAPRDRSRVAAHRPALQQAPPANPRRFPAPPRTSQQRAGLFINNTLIRYFKDRAVPVKHTRFRSYIKNDNAHAEERNRPGLPGENGTLASLALPGQHQPRHRCLLLWSHRGAPLVRVFVPFSAQTAGVGSPAGSGSGGAGLENQRPSQLCTRSM